MKILFLYNYNWDKELVDFRAGKVPTHRLWGYADVERAGHEAVAAPKPKWLQKWWLQPQRWRVWQALYALTHQREIDCMVAVMETAGLPVLVLKKLGLLRTPLVILNMALLHRSNCTGFKKKLWIWLLPASEAVVSLARPHLDWVAAEFGLKRERQHFIPMLVDTDFFTPDPTAKKGDYCLSVGTNEGKDFETLVKAFPKNEKLIIVTDAYNAGIVAQHVTPDQQIEVKQAVPIDQLRTYYKEAKLHIIPLADGRLGSGHTVLLENMALGRILIVSDAPSMSDYLEDGVNALAVQPHNVEQLREKIRDCLAAPERYAALGPQAASWARTHFSSTEFARQLLGIIGKLTGEVATPKAVPVEETVG